MTALAANKEDLHEDVYGESFALYSKQDMLEFIAPLEIRYERNKIDAKAAFAGKKCLDAGCGNGRGSIFMSSNGATSVDCIDISPMNIESTEKNAKLFGFEDRISCHNASLEEIPFDDETFDFVWCNGVIMHTHNPDKCLSELSRVLKKGGQAWIYVYGSGGVYWQSVYRARAILEPYSEKDCVDVLKHLLTPNGFLAEYIDDWKAPYLRSYIKADFNTRLAALGFETPAPLALGTDYDTSHRISSYAGDVDYLGEGDLRYFITKAGDPNYGESGISDSIYGSDYTYPDLYKTPLDEKFDQLENALKDQSLIVKISALAHIQRYLRDQIFAKAQPFDFNAYLNVFEDVQDILKRA